MLRRLPRQSKRTIYSLSILLGAIAVVYLVWPSQTFSEAEDSIVFVQRVAEDAPHFHPNHLLYEPLQWLAYTGAKHLLPHLSALQVMQGLTTVLSLVALWMVHSLVADRQGPGTALVATALVGGCFGFWHYATVPDIYVPALAIALVAMRVHERTGAATVARLLCLGLLVSLATLVHQLYLFFGFILGVALLLEARTSEDRLRVLSVFVPVCTLSILGAYWLAFSTGDQVRTGLVDFVRWSMGYARDGLWKPPSALTPLFGTLGAAMVVSKPISFLLEPFTAEIVGRIAQNRLIVEESFAATNGIRPGVGNALIGLTILVFAQFAILVGVAGRDWYRRQSMAPGDRVLLAFVLLYSLLALVWEADNLEFWIHVVVVAIILGARLIDPRPLATRILALTAVGCLWVVNFASTIGPYSDAANDFWLQSNAALIAASRESDVVITECPWLCQRYLGSLSDSEIIIASEAVPSRTDGNIARLAVAPVILSSWALRPPVREAPQARQQRETFLRSLERVTNTPLPPETSGRADAQILWRRTATGWTRLD